MNLSELKKDAVYVNMRGFDEMVVLDTENLYAEFGFRIGVSVFNEPGDHVAVLHNVSGYSDDLVKLAKKVKFNGSEKGASYKQPDNGTAIRFVKLHEIAGERDAIRAALKDRREIKTQTSERYDELSETISGLIPGASEASSSPEREVTINIDLLEQLVALAQKGKEIQ